MLEIKTNIITVSGTGRSLTLAKESEAYNCLFRTYPAGIYLLKVSNKNTRKRCEIWSKLTIKTYFTPYSTVSIVNFEHVIAGWVRLFLKLYDEIFLMSNKL